MMSAKSLRQEVLAELLTMFEGVQVTSFVCVWFSICCFQMESLTEQRLEKLRTVNVYILSELP